MKKIKMKYFLFPFFLFLFGLGIFSITKYALETAIGLTDVYVAKVNIRKRSKIEESYLTKIKVPRAYIDENVYVELDDILGKYVVSDGFIAKGSLFYKSYLQDRKDMEDVYFTYLNDGEYAYDLRVKDIDVNTASIKEGQYVDLYLTINRKEVLSDLLIEGARIIGIYDNQNREVLTNKEANIMTITIALQKEMIPYLNKALAIGEIKITSSSSLYDEQKCKMNLSDEVLEYLS